MERNGIKKKNNLSRPVVRFEYPYYLYGTIGKKIVNYKNFKQLKKIKLQYESCLCKVIYKKKLRSLAGC